jgi:hypothetical protein
MQRIEADRSPVTASAGQRSVVINEPGMIFKIDNTRTIRHTIVRNVIDDSFEFPGTVDVSAPGITDFLGHNHYTHI